MKPKECKGELLTSFYDSVVAPAVFYRVVCWSSSISAAGRRRLDKLIKKASSILGCPLDPVQVVGESKIMDNQSCLLLQESHPLQVSFTALGSSFSNRHQCCHFILVICSQSLFSADWGGLKPQDEIRSHPFPTQSLAVLSFQSWCFTPTLQHQIKQ